MISLARPLSSYASGIAQAALDTRHGLCLLPRGAITEILGEPATGRTALAYSMLATATRAGEVAAVIDADDTFDPESAHRAGADLGKLLWVQCSHRVEVALKAADMILHAGGFGFVLLDLCDASASALNRVPTSFWYRVQRAMERTPTALLVMARHSIARSCAARQLSLEHRQFVWRGDPPFQVIERLNLQAALRKPAPSAPVEMEALAEA